MLLILAQLGWAGSACLPQHRYQHVAEVNAGLLSLAALPSFVVCALLNDSAMLCWTQKTSSGIHAIGSLLLHGTVQVSLVQMRLLGPSSLAGRMLQQSFR